MDKEEHSFRSMEDLSNLENSRMYKLMTHIRVLSTMFQIWKSDYKRCRNVYGDTKVGALFLVLLGKSDGGYNYGYRT